MYRSNQNLIMTNAPCFSTSPHLTTYTPHSEEAINFLDILKPYKPSALRVNDLKMSLYDNRQS